MDIRDANGRSGSLQALYNMKISAHNKAVCGQQFQSGWSFTVYDRCGK